MANITNRKFGIEIECVGANREAVATAMTTAGVRCEIQYYNHNTQNVWKIVEDASVSNGFELVSPPLCGQEGLRQVEIAMRTLVANGARVNRSCGFHVHVDAADLTVHDLMNIVKRYHKFENKIDAIMPQSRRANNNSFCQSMTNFFNRNSNLERFTDVRRLCGTVNDRYYKVNLSAFMRHGTVEFRQHSGTVNATKAINWVVFCVTMVETSRRIEQVTHVTVPAAPTANVVDNPRNITLRAAAAARFNTMLTMFRNGSTVEAVANATGLSASTIRTYLSSRISEMGYRVIATRQTGTVYIRARVTEPGQVVVAGSARTARAPTVQTTTVVRTVDPIDVDPFTALEPEIISYYAERATEFGVDFN